MIAHRGLHVAISADVLLLLCQIIANPLLIKSNIDYQINPNSETALRGNKAQLNALVLKRLLFTANQTKNLSLQAT